jgi:hypothetical protein
VQDVGAQQDAEHPAGKGERRWTVLTS